jgi:hypothetical protein
MPTDAYSALGNVTFKIHVFLSVYSQTPTTFHVSTVSRGAAGGIREKRDALLYCACSD